jgi:site-specific DNA recombinase
VATAWIAETQNERKQILAQQQAGPPNATEEGPAYQSAVEIDELFDEVGGMVGALRKATPEKSEVYRNLGLRLTYLPETKTVRADVDLAAHRGASVCVRGGT